MTEIGDMLRQRCARCGHPRGGHYSETARNCLHRDDNNFGTCPCELFTIVEEAWTATLGGQWAGETKTVIVRQHVPDGGFWTGTIGEHASDSQSRCATAQAARDAVFAMFVQVVEWKLVERPTKKLRPSRAQMRAALLLAELFVEDVVRIGFNETADDRVLRRNRALDLHAVLLASLGKAPK